MSATGAREKTARSIARVFIKMLRTRGFRGLTVIGMVGGPTVGVYEAYKSDKVTEQLKDFNASKNLPSTSTDDTKSTQR